MSNFYYTKDIDKLSKQINKEKTIQYFIKTNEIYLIEKQFSKNIDSVTRQELAYWILHTQGGSKNRIRQKFC